MLHWISIHNTLWFLSKKEKNSSELALLGCITKQRINVPCSWQDGKCVHCKYLPLSPYKPLEKFSKALYGTKGGTYSARIFRPVMVS